MSRAKRNAAAEDYFNRAPGYSAEAIDVLRAISARADIPKAAEIASGIVSLFLAAHKFILPDYGVITEGPFQDWWLDGARLPYPAVALEFDSPTKTPVPDGRVPCERKVVLAWEVPGRLGEPSISVLVFTWSSRDNRWLPYPLLVELPCVDCTCNASAILVPFGEPGQILIERSPKIQGEVYEPLSEISTELTAVANFCAALSCTNVTTEVIRPNREARAARPASTLFDYHVIVLDPSRVREPGEDRGGTHASPRTHLRRGHIRRLAWGPRIWVNSCVVNPSAIGTVNKDYAVRGPS